MNKEEIQKAFEGRWRIKGNMGQINSNSATMSFDEFFEYIKSMCYDFFEAGVMIATPIEVINISDADFETWWNLYDKKCGRKDCEKKWKKLTEQEKSECIAATPAYVRSTPDKAYRKNPLTYLNQKAWNDEIINRNGTNKPTIEQQRRDKLASILTD